MVEKHLFTSESVSVSQSQQASLSVLASVTDASKASESVSVATALSNLEKALPNTGTKESSVGLLLGLGVLASASVLAKRAND